MPLARALNLIPASQVTGKLNSISDVPGVMVGHQSIHRGNARTGVTAVLPHGGNMFQEKVRAAVEVFNGFGKSCGLMQVTELGTIETPILLSNTFAVGTCANALIRKAISENPDIGRTTSTVNPVVCECNDGWLSDIQALAVTEDDAIEAIRKACDLNVEQGAVGAGTSMKCLGYKSGIGTSSRVLNLDGQQRHLGVLVLSNFGSPGDLILPGGKQLPTPQAREADKGSIIMIVATDIEMETRQLHRVIKRCGVGLARTGSYWGHGSGDLVVGFSTAGKIPHSPTQDYLPSRTLHESRLDDLFRLTADCTVEAILNSLTMAPDFTGRDGNSIKSLLNDLQSAR